MLQDEIDALLLADPGTLSDAARCSLFERIIDAFSNERRTVPWDVATPAWRDLTFPGLPARLHECVTSPNARVRHVALLIAFWAECETLVGPAIREACDSTHALTHRKSAVHLVMRFGSHHDKRALLHLAEVDPARDPEEDLRALVLEGLWPAAVSGAELFPLLTRPRVQNLSGSYVHFLNEFAVHLTAGDLGPALDWLGDHGLHGRERPEGLDGVAARVIEIGSDREIERLYEIAESAIQQHIASPLQSALVAVSEVAIRFFRVAYRKIRTSPASIDALEWLADESHAPFVAGALSGASDDDERAFWFGLLIQLARKRSDIDGLFLETAWGHPALRARLDLFIPLDLPWVERMRTAKANEAREKAERLRARLAAARATLSNEDPGVGWPEFVATVSPAWGIDFKELQVWSSLSDVEQRQACSIAYRFLAGTDERRNEWRFGWSWSSHAFHGAAAIALLVEDGTYQDKLRPLWRRWMAAVLSVACRDPAQSDASIRAAIASDVDSVIGVLIENARLRSQAADSNYLPRRCADSWSTHMSRTLARAALRERWSPCALADVLEPVVEHDPDVAAECLTALCREYDGSWERGARIAYAAAMVMSREPSRVWPPLARFVRDGPEVLEWTLLRLATAHLGRRRRLAEALPESACAALFALLATRYPYNHDRHAEERVSWRRSLDDLQNDFLRALTGRGTPAAFADLEQLRALFPSAVPLEALDIARRALADRTWSAPEIADLLRIAFDLKRDGPMDDRVRVLVSYAREGEHHDRRVAELVGTLRRDHGIDATFDQAHPFPEEGWTRFMAEQIRSADFVLMICTPQYRQRAEGRSPVGSGAGATYEGYLIDQALFQANMKNTKFIPVLFESGAAESIPDFVQGFTYVRWPTDEMKLVDRLHGVQPFVEPLGVVSKKQPP